MSKVLRNSCTHPYLLFVNTMSGINRNAMHPPAYKLVQTLIALFKFELHQNNVRQR